MKVTTKDFQRLKGENVFEFPVGLTVIQGRSGSGKSTVFYAVEDCLSNPSGVADVINWDAKSCEVTLENDGGYVKWIKTPSSCEYVDKDGKPYVKASKLDSRNIDNLGFYFDKKGEIVNIHNEWSVLFPFGASDTEMFKLFEDIFNISSSFQIIENIKKEEQDYKAKINSVNAQTDDITRQNNSIDDILSKIDVNVDKYIQAIDEKQVLVSNISNDCFTLSSNQKYINIDIPNELDTTLLTKTKEYYEQIQNDYNTLLVNKRRAEIVIPEEKKFEIKQPDSIADYTVFKTALEVVSQYDQILEKLVIEEKTLQEQLGSIKICPTCGRPMEVN